MGLLLLHKKPVWCHTGFLWNSYNNLRIALDCFVATLLAMTRGNARHCERSEAIHTHHFAITPQRGILYVYCLIPLLRRGGAKRRGGLGLACASRIRLMCVHRWDCCFCIKNPVWCHMGFLWSSYNNLRIALDCFVATLLAMTRGNTRHCERSETIHTHDFAITPQRGILYV